jgi:hypothetical protein
LKKNIKTGFPMLFKFLLILCFFIFPLFLLSSTVQSYFKIQNENRKKQITLKAEEQLNIMQKISDGSRYFHLVFAKLFKKNLSEEKLNPELARRISFLKSRFPNSLKFIVWNKKGALIKSLSDEKSYMFFLNKLNSFLKKIQALTINSYPETPSLPQELQKEKRNFKKFLGPFIPAVKIAESFIPGKKSKCFQMYPTGDKSYGWYKAHRNYSILIYIDHTAINSLQGCKTICTKFANKAGTSRLLMINRITGKTYPQTTSHIKRHLKINLEKKINLSNFVQPETNNYHYCFQKLDIGWWAAALIDKNKVKLNNFSIDNFITQIVAAIFILSFIFYCFLLVHKNPLNSINARLMVIFTYTVAIPVMIFATTGFEYVSEMSTKIESDTGAQLYSFLNKIDARFTSFNNRKAKIVTKFFDQYFKTHAPESTSREDFLHLAKNIDQSLKPDIIMFFNRKGEDLLEQKYSRHLIDNTFLRSMAKTFLNFFNNTDPTVFPTVTILLKSSLESFGKNNQKINYLELVNQTFYFYSYLAKTHKTNNFHLYLQIFWKIKKFHKLFYNELKQGYYNNSSIKPVLYFPDTKATLSIGHDWPELNNFLERIDLHGSKLEEIKTADNRKILAAGFRGNWIKNTIIAATISYNSLYNRIQDLKTKLATLLIMTIIFSVSLYQLLHHQILIPVNKLIDGVKLVKSKSYQKRVNFESKNELGNLSKSINHSLENLQEFEIAKTVQESLLPQSSISNEVYEIEGRTHPMSKLGGDYFDFTLTPENEILLLMGDVAGHGVQAALMMAMAKSVFMLEQTGPEAHVNIMKSLNQTFYRLRKSSIKTMMTGQVVLLSNQADSLITNAGHTTPIIINENSIETINLASYPFGFSQKRKFKFTPFRLKENDIMVLYTDGIIESLNSREEMLGNEGFADMLKAAYSKNLNEFHNNIFALYNDWATSQSDDLTFLLIKRKENA